MIGFKIITGDRDYHTFRDFGLSWVSYNRPLPSPQLALIQVVGRSGTIDITDSIYEQLPYSNTIATAVLDAVVPFDEYPELEKHLISVHGAYVKIILDESENEYIEGRLSVTINYDGYSVVDVTLSLDSQPYKMRVSETVVELAQGVNLVFNEQKLVVPKIIVSSDNCEIKFKNVLYGLNTGINEIAEFVLSKGTNEVELISGTARLEYREGVI